MTVNELIRRLRMFPPDAVVAYETKLGRNISTADAIEACQLKYGRKTGSEVLPTYVLRGGTVPVVIIR